MPSPELARSLYEETALDRDRWHRRALDAEIQLTEARAEIKRLLDVAQKEPHTAFLEAVQRACDERLVKQKHRIRELEATLAALQDRAPAEPSEETDYRCINGHDLCHGGISAGPECPYCERVPAEPAPEKQWIRGHVGGSSPTTGNGDEP